MTQPSAGLQRFPQEDRIDEPGGLQEVTAVLLTCWPLVPPPRPSAAASYRVAASVVMSTK
jgi:hypothetical protein